MTRRVQPALLLLFALFGASLSRKIVKTTDDCQNTFPHFLNCVKKKLRIAALEGDLEAELNDDFTQLTKQCFVEGRSFSVRGNKCPLTPLYIVHPAEGPLSRSVRDYISRFFKRTPTERQCVRAKLYAMFPKLTRNCYKNELNDPMAEPELLPDIDGDAENVTQLIERTYNWRMHVYSSTANCARSQYDQARTSTSCLTKQPPRMYNKHCVKLMAGCLQNSLTVTGLSCINRFDVVKRAMCACALVHRKRIMNNMLDLSHVFRYGGGQLCKSKLTDVLDQYLPAVETAFRSCLRERDFLLRARLALISACAAAADDAALAKREDAIQAVYHILAFFQSTIDRFDRFCQADCPHQLLIDYMQALPR